MTRGFSPALLAKQVLLVAAILGAWEWGVRSGLMAAYIYGQPSGIYAKAKGLIASGELLTHTWVTAQEAVAGFLIGSTLGSLCGLLLWLSPGFAAVVRPVMIAICGDGAPIRLPTKKHDPEKQSCKICHSAMRGRFAGGNCCGDNDEEEDPGP